MDLFACAPTFLLIFIWHFCFYASIWHFGFSSCLHDSKPEKYMICSSKNKRENHGIHQEIAEKKEKNLQMEGCLKVTMNNTMLIKLRQYSLLFH
jgi:hypothetical protein